MLDPAIIASLITGGLSVASGLYARSANKRLRTKNGKTVAQHVEDLVTWSHIHTEQDNEIRDALGINRADYPDLTAWRNER